VETVEAGLDSLGPHDDLPALQRLKAEGERTNGQGPLAYTCPSGVQNGHAEILLRRMTARNADELTGDIQCDRAVGVLVPARNFAEDVPRQSAAQGRIHPGEEILLGAGRRSRVVDLVPFDEEDESPFDPTGRGGVSVWRQRLSCSWVVYVR